MYLFTLHHRWLRRTKMWLRRSLCGRAGAGATTKCPAQPPKFKKCSRRDHIDVIFGRASSLSLAWRRWLRRTNECGCAGRPANFRGNMAQISRESKWNLIWDWSRLIELNKSAPTFTFQFDSRANLMPFPLNFLPLIFDDLPGTDFFDPSHLHISFEIHSRQDITDPI